MKIELDYDKKTIKLGTPVDLKTFVKKIKRILPDWDEWTLDTNTEIVWESPIVIGDHYPPPYIHVEPWWRQPQIYFGDNTGTNYLSTNTMQGEEPVSGSYQIEIK